MLISCAILSTVFKSIHNPCKDYDKKFQVRSTPDEIEFSIIYDEQLFTCCTLSCKELEEFTQTEFVIDEKFLNKIILVCNIYKKDFLNISVVDDLIIFKLCRPTQNKITNQEISCTISIENNLCSDIIYKPVSYKPTFSISTDIFKNLLEIACMNDSIMLIFNINNIYIKNGIHVESCANVFNAKNENVSIRLENKTVFFLIDQLNNWKSKVCNIYMSKTSIFMIEIDNVQIYSTHDTT